VEDDYKNELGFLRDLNKSKEARDFVVDLMGDSVPSKGDSEVRYGIAMELLSENLNDFLKSKNSLTPQLRVALAVNLVKAVQAIHSAKVAHCDLKPHQVCLHSGIELKLIDFDSARYIGSFKPLDRLTDMYAAPEVARAKAEGKLSTFSPTKAHDLKAIDLWPLGLMLAQIFHPDLEPVFESEKAAKDTLLGEDLMVFIDKHVSKISKSQRQSVAMLLRFHSEERCSASQVLDVPIFKTGFQTMIENVTQNQENILLGQERLESMVKATQRMIVECGDTTIPRVVMLVPVDLEKKQSNMNDFIFGLATKAEIVKRYDLCFVCEGCTLFPMTECSCGNKLNNSVRFKMPGATLKKLTPALKAAAMLYKVASVAGNAAGVRLTLEIPGVSDVVEFAKAVNNVVDEFAAVAGEAGVTSKVMGAAPKVIVKDHGQSGAAAASGTRAYGAAYTALATLLKQSGVVPKDNTCRGLLKVTDREGGAVYWVCKAHAEAHAARLLNTSTRNLEQASAGIDPSGLPEDLDVATALATDMAASREVAEREVTAQEIAISKLWTEGNFSAAVQEVSELVNVLDDFARVSDEWAQFAAKEVILAKEAAAKGFQNKAKAEQLKGNIKITSCQGGCGVKLISISISVFGKPKRNCKACGLVVCAECSPPPKQCVEGYSGLQRVCKKCVEARDLQIDELDAAAEEAAAQSVTAQENAQRARDDEAGATALSDVSHTTTLFLDRTLSAAVAEREFGRAAALERKLAQVRNLDSQRKELKTKLAEANAVEDLPRWRELDAELKASPVLTLAVAIALDAFSVNTVVCASIAGSNEVAAGTAGEVIGHTRSGKVEVLFKEGTAVFELASLKAADLPNGWAVNQTCFAVVDLSTDEIITGQKGIVLGWSKPFDREKIMADFGGRHMNVLLSYIETTDQFNKVCAIFFKPNFVNFVHKSVLRLKLNVYIYLSTSFFASMSSISPYALFNIIKNQPVSPPPRDSVASPLRVIDALPDNGEAQRALFAMLPERVQAIIGKGLANRSAPLSGEDSLAVLTACIRIGVERADLALEKTAVVVIGNTGAGKSTFVNYILNCVLEKVRLRSNGEERSI